MIQAPNLQYIPAQQTAQQAYMPQAANNAVQYNQTPGVIYNYPTASSYLPQTYYPQSTPQYNGVNIEIHNPQGQAGMPNTMPAQYMPVQQTMPYMMPQPIMQQPIQQPAMQQPAIQQPAMQPAAVQNIPAEPITGQTQAVPAPQVQPAAQQGTAQAAAPVIDTPQTVDPNMTPAAFAGRLKTDDVDAQKAAIEEIAEAVKYNDQLAPSLLDTQVFDALIDIVNKDTSALEGPTPEVIELRQKPESELTPEQKELAKTPSPQEKAEINKQYAIYTMAYLQERLNNELEKRGGSALELKDLPGIDKIVDTVKSNPNPLLRVCAIAALSHIAKPQYNEDLKTILELAKKDEDPNVQEAANKALGLLK